MEFEFKGKGELYNVNFCESEGKEDPIQEESLVLHFSKESGFIFTELSVEEIDGFVNGGVRDGFPMGKGSVILSDTFNLTINGFEFKGEKFTSAELKRIKKVGEIVVLRCKVAYREDFHESFPSFIRSMVDIEIKSVGQKTIPSPEENEE